MSSVHKSYHEGIDPVIAYTSRLTTKLSPLQQELQDATLKNAPISEMLGAPEVLTIGQDFLQLIGAKNVLDIGTYTGASALAWSLAIPDDGKVYTLDVSHENLKKFGLPIISKCSKTLGKIEAHEGPALEFLDKLITDGKAGTFDFGFIDADKVNYSNYYDRLVALLRKGGVILVDNALWGGSVTNYDPKSVSESTKAIDDCNHKIFADDRTNSFLVNTGDGIHVAFKK